MKETIKSLKLLIDSIDKESKNEPDDFNYFLMKDLQTMAGKTLYMLTRGEEGIPNNLKLELLEVKNYE